MLCRSCSTDVTEVEMSHWVEPGSPDGYGHSGLCCDCFDSSCGMPLEQINKERRYRGVPPLVLN